MKIIFLNAFYGEIPEITDFIKSQTKDTDIFCFQEANDYFLNLSRKALENYQLYVANKIIVQEGNPPEDHLPQAIFVRKGYEVISSEELLDGDPKMGFALCLQVSIKNKILNVCNFHGIPLPGHKLDTGERLKQSKGMIKHYQDTPGAKIIGGDFNVLPQAKSISMFEDAGYRNLIKEFGIKTTRNEIAWKNYPNNKQYFSDYVFVSPEVKVKQFNVPEVTISDHLPLILEIEV